MGYPEGLVEKKRSRSGIDESYLFNAPPAESVRRRFQIKTRIICTIGPKTSSKEQILNLAHAGMNVARLNFSHGTREYHQKVIDNIRAAREELGNPGEIAILLDTKGPEIRTGTLENGENVNLLTGQTFTFYTDPSVIGNKNQVSVSYADLPQTMNVGDTILMDDGLIGLKVVQVSCEQGYVRCIVENDGELGERKGINLPGKKVNLESITDKDIMDIKFGLENDVDFIAVSFVRKAEDVHCVRKHIEGSGIRIIAKIENHEGLENFDEILEAADAIMIARGDLGVEIPVEKVFRYQKLGINRCNLAGKPVITATQMLESMVVNPRPTRAEATDIANAVLDGSDCVMLSGETAKGNFPVRAVSVMFNICRESECDIQYREWYDKMGKNFMKLTSVGESIAMAAVNISWSLRATLIIVLTETGNMANFFAKHRPVAPVVAVTSSIKVVRHCAILRGIYPLLVEKMSGTEGIVLKAMKWGIENGMVHVGDPVVVTSGVIEGKAGSTNMIRVLSCMDS